MYLTIMVAHLLLCVSPFFSWKSENQVFSKFRDHCYLKHPQSRKKENSETLETFMGPRLLQRLSQ